MRKLLPLSLAAALSLAPLALAARQPAPPAVQQDGHSPAPDHGEGREAAKAEAKPETTEKQGKEGAEEAKGEESVKLFGHELDNGGKWGIQVLNFLIFAGALIFMVKGPLAAAFKARAKELEDRLAQAEKDKAEGEAQIRELEAKMSGLESELAGILAKAEQDAEVEKQRTLEAARAEASAILAQASAEIDHQKRQAEQELRALVAELAVEAAAKRLEAQVQGASATQAVDRAISRIGGIQ